MRNSKTLFLLADGARARLVERSPETGDFVTFEEIDARRSLEQLRSELRASPAAANFQSGTPQRHQVTAGDRTRLAKEAFVAEVADHAAKICEKRGFEHVVVAAPARLPGPLKAGLTGRTHLAAALERDLTKAPDAALPRWLDHIPPV